MTDKQLQKMKRSELLELMLEQSRRIDELEAELAAVKAELEDKNIRIREAGSIAQAAMDLNGVFEAAQRAADQYLENIRRMHAAQEGTNHE